MKIEMLPARFKPHTISTSNDRIVYEGAIKLMFFSKTGKLIKEVRKNLTAFNFISQNIQTTDKFVSLFNTLEFNIGDKIELYLSENSLFY